MQSVERIIMRQTGIVCGRVLRTGAKCAIYDFRVLFAGFSDVGEAWQMTDYDETGIESMVLRLYDQIKPFYQQLHTHVRRRLAEVYPNHGMDQSGPIPAHLLGTRVFEVVEILLANC